MARPHLTAALTALAVAAATPAAAQNPSAPLRSLKVNTNPQDDQEFTVVQVDGDDVTGPIRRSFVIDVNRHRPVSNRWRVEFTLIDRTAQPVFQFERTYSFSVATNALPGSRTLLVQRDQWSDCTQPRVTQVLTFSEAPTDTPAAVRYLMNIQDMEAKCATKPVEAEKLRIGECRIFLFLRSRDVDWLEPRGELPLDPRGCKNYRPRSFT